MESATEIATRLTKASRKKLWDVYGLDWPEQLQEGAWYMSPELVSIYGTELWDSLDEAQQKKLSLYETGNFFSIVLQGERPLVQGLVHRLYLKASGQEITEYLHHFVDEENKHMVMFGEFCHRYIGKVYPEKKISLPREYAKGEEEVAFFCKVMTVEELGDYYNVLMMKDDNIDPLVKEINRIHHDDEARHLAFGRLYTAELFDKYASKWDDETLEGFRSWLVEYLRSSWGDYYNPTMYKDAGLADPYEVRQLAMKDPVCAAQRQKVSEKLVNYFVKHGLLAEVPTL